MNPLIVDIRPATAEDIPTLLDMGEEFNASSIYASLFPMDRPSVESTLLRMLDNPKESIILVAGDPIVAMIGLIAYDNFTTGKKTASELFWWSNTKGRGVGSALLDVAENWAKHVDASQLVITIPDDTDRLDAYLRKRGMSPFETNYVKTV